MGFPKWMFFQLNFGAKKFEIGQCVLNMPISLRMSFNRKVDFEKNAIN